MSQTIMKLNNRHRYNKSAKQINKVSDIGKLLKVGDRYNTNLFKEVENIRVLQIQGVFKLVTIMSIITYVHKCKYKLHCNVNFIAASSDK